jgi:hypothetical protein
MAALAALGYEYVAIVEYEYPLTGFKLSVKILLRG